MEAETKQTRLMAFESRSTWVILHQNRTIHIQLLASLLLLLLLQFPLIILHLHRSVLCADHPYPCPQPLYMFSGPASLSLQPPKL